MSRDLLCFGEGADPTGRQDVLTPGLQVDVSLPAAAGAAGVLSLSFRHLTAVNVLTVDGELQPSKGKALAGPALLAAIFPEDDGMVNPSPAAVYRTEQAAWSSRCAFPIVLACLLPQADLLPQCLLPACFHCGSKEGRGALRTQTLLRPCWPGPRG